VAVAHAGGSVFTSLTKSIASTRLLPDLKVRIRAFRLGLLGTLVSFGTWNLIRRLASTIRTNINPIILNQWGTSVDVTCFYLGSIFRRQTMQGWALVSTPLAPALTAMAATDQHRRLQNTFLRGARYALWATMALALPLAVYRNEVFTLYAGAEYSAAALVTLLLLMTIPIEMSTSLLGPTVFATGHVRSHAWRTMLLQSVNVALTLVLVGAFGFGAVGAAAATLFSIAALHPLLMWPLATRLLNLRYRELFARGVGPGLLPAAVGAVVWIALAAVVRPTGWWTLGWCFSAGFAAYLLALLTMALQPSDRNDLAKALAALRNFPGARRRAVALDEALEEGTHETPGR